MTTPADDIPGLRDDLRILRRVAHDDDLDELFVLCSTPPKSTHKMLLTRIVLQHGEIAAEMIASVVDAWREANMPPSEAA